MSGIEAPGVLGDRGAALWIALHETMEFDPHEAELLLDACRHLDMAEELAVAVARDGATVSGSRGQTVVHPAMQEYRQIMQGATRLLAALHLDSVDVLDQLAKQRAMAAADRTRRWRERKAAQSA